MRSGREHNTPDKAMWGFLITVRAQESTEEVFFRKNNEVRIVQIHQNRNPFNYFNLILFFHPQVSNGLPFLADLALGLSVLACTMLHLLYQGPEKTKDEEICQHLLKTKLLQRYAYHNKINEVTKVFTPCCLSNGVARAELPACRQSFNPMLSSSLTLFLGN